MCLRKMAMISQKPDPYPNLEQHSVVELCAIGQEIVQEIQVNTINLMALLRSKHNSSAEYSSVDHLSEHCAVLFRKLNEVRVIVDQQRRGAGLLAHMSADEMLDVLATDGEPPSDEHWQGLIDEVAAQQTQIITLKCRLKMLEWMSTVSDQRLVKRAELSTAADDKEIKSEPAQATTAATVR